MRVGTTVGVGVIWAERGPRGTCVLVRVLLGVLEGRGVQVGGIRVLDGATVGKCVAVTPARVATAGAVTGRAVGLGVIVEPSETLVPTNPPNLFGKSIMPAAAATRARMSSATACQRRQ